MSLDEAFRKQGYLRGVAITSMFTSEIFPTQKVVSVPMTTVPLSSGVWTNGGVALRQHVTLGIVTALSPPLQRWLLNGV